MKKYCHCKKEKDLEEFNFKNKISQIRQKACKECTRLEIRRHYDQNKIYYLEKAHKRNKEHRMMIQKYIYEFLLAHPCVDCNEKDPVVLDFDHLGNKIAPVSTILRGNYPLTTIQKEISKCVVRCANCHRRKTSRDLKWYKDLFASVA